MNSTEANDMIYDGETAIDFIVFETERLIVREFNADDFESVSAYVCDPENTVYMDLGIENREDAENFVFSRLKEQLTSERRLYDFAICLRETGEMIGSAGLFLSTDRLQAELGYILDKKYWGFGYAAEAAEGLLRFGFTCLDLHRIYARCDSENAASERVMQRIGMRKEGEFKSSRYMRLKGRLQWRSEKQYAMLQREYLNLLADSEKSLF